MVEKEMEAADSELLCLKESMEDMCFHRIYDSAVQKAMEITKKEVERLEEETHREIISTIYGRVKAPESVQRKLCKKGCDCKLETAMTKLNDIAGMRATCYFMDDVYELAGRLKRNKQMRFLMEKNYIDKPKASGYKSLHLIVEIPILTGYEEEWIKTEIQIRTLAMDFWAKLDHRICYKKDLIAVKAVQKDLREYADIISRVDVQMLSLRKKMDAL